MIRFNYIKIFVSTLVIYFFILNSCTSHKRLIYLSNLDTAAIELFHPFEKPDYQIQYQDILYINISTMNSEMNEILNPLLYQSAANVFRDERSFYIFGYTVNDSGYISLPVFGDLYIFGLTLQEVSDLLKDRSKELLKDATINVRLLSYKFTVIGEVNNPGTYLNYNNQLTVLEAIGMAGDITDYGNREQVLVVRPSKEGTHTYRINVQDKNLLQSEGYFLLPNDIVVIEPIKSKSFLLNIPTMTLFLTTISTLVLVLTLMTIK